MDFFGVGSGLDGDQRKKHVMANDERGRGVVLRV